MYALPRRVQTDPVHERNNNGGETASPYTALKPDQIRLLVLEPGTSDEPIKCLLEHWNVLRVRPYFALSYRWGDPGAKTSKITVNGRPFAIPANLEEFLSRFRSINKQAVLWIDAVCINQRDFREKNAQIRLMKRVYEGADSVVIWLGNAILETEQALQAIDFLYSVCWDEKFGFSDLTPERALSSASATKVHEVLVKMNESYPNCWTGIQDIFSRQWWSRVWVYQEPSAPSKSGNMVHCGAFSIAFHKLLAFNTIVRYLGFKYADLSHLQRYYTLSAAAMDICCRLREDYHKRGRSTFLRLYVGAPGLRNFGATDPRDKLYSLVPIVVDGAELLNVDYSLSVEEVYTSATVSVIQHTRNLDILAHCYAPGHESSFRLPSWVPDWTFTGNPIPFLRRGSSTTPDIYADQHYSMLYHTCRDRPAIAWFDRAKTKLFCVGFAFDVVRIISPLIGRTFDDMEVAYQWKKWLKAESVEVDEDTFGDTLVADCYRPMMDVGMRGRNAKSNGITLPLEPNLQAGISTTGTHPATFRRKLFVTSKGLLGLGAKEIASGDVVAILMGAQLPFILRRIEDHFILVSETYVHGIVDGEAMKTEDAKSPRIFEIW